MYAVETFKNHNLVKQTLLNLINQSNFQSCIDPGCETNITKTDWYLSKDFNREWVNFFAENFTETILQMFNEVGYDGYTLHDIWFQQYKQNSGHGWHIHSENFTNVYYLELPKNAPTTKLVNPYNQRDIIEIDVKEGDIIVFPSYVIHKGPANLCNEQKTIISYNINATYSNKIYGKGIEDNAIF